MRARWLRLVSAGAHDLGTKNTSAHWIVDSRYYTDRAGVFLEYSAQARLQYSMAQPDIHSHQVVEVELLQKKEMGNIGQNENRNHRHISRVYVLFALLVSAQSCQGHTEAGSLTLDTRVAATIFRAAAVGQVCKIFADKERLSRANGRQRAAALSRSTLRRVTRDIM